MPRERRQTPKRRQTPQAPHWKPSPPSLSSFRVQEGAQPWVGAGIRQPTACLSSDPWDGLFGQLPAGRSAGPGDRTKSSLGSHAEMPHGFQDQGRFLGISVTGPFRKATLDSSLATTPWPSHLMSLSLSFPSHKMELTVLAWGGGGVP